MDKGINRIKVVFAEKEGAMETFLKIAELLDVEQTELVRTNKSQIEQRNTIYIIPVA